MGAAGLFSKASEIPGVLGAAWYKVLLITLALYGLICCTLACTTSFISVTKFWLQV